MANRKTLLFIVLIFVAVGAVLAGFIAYTMSSWEYRGCFTSIAFSSDGSRMLTRIGGGGAGMLLWDVDTGREIRTIRSGGVDHMAFSPDGHKVVTGGTYGVVLYDVDTGERLHLFEGSSSSRSRVSGPCVDFSSDGNYILSADSEENIILWDARTYEKVRTFLVDGSLTATSEGKIHSIRFSPDGRSALSAGDRLILWNVETGRMSRIFNGHKKKSPIVNAIITTDGRFVLSGSWDCTLRVWSMESGEQLQSIRVEHFPGIISFSPDGRFAVTGKTHFNDAIEVWDMNKGAFSFALRTSKGKEGLSFSVSPDGRKVAAGLCGRVELWNIETRKRILTFRRTPRLPLILSDIIWRYVRI